MPKGLAAMGRMAMNRVRIVRVKLRAAFLLVSVLLAGGATAQTGRGAGSGSAYRVPLAFARAEKLKRGINASEWFAQVYDKRGYTPEHFQSWTTPEDIALIKSMGFDHLRLSLNPKPMSPTPKPTKIPPNNFAFLT